ncbi:hypothetical protein [Streptomyces olindensis]|uniref:hypothetical protein n=1 Tax=Streptomyces olindensis TaxID=358823 RepID=UPI003669C2E8
MVKPGKKTDSKQRPLIVVAGEGDYDRQVLQHLLPVLLPVRGLLIEPIRSDKTDLSKADKKLSPHIDKLHRLAKGMAVRKRARLMGIVVHVDFDAVADDQYHATRERISADLARAFSPQYESALALAVSSTEGWLMLFPEAFPELKKSWQLPHAIRNQDLGMIVNAKKHLKGLLKQPPYSESHAPELMEKAVLLARSGKHGIDISNPSGRNCSYTDFVRDLKSWKSS